jgi:hypothetical protein
MGRRSNLLTNQLTATQVIIPRSPCGVGTGRVTKPYLQ